MKKLPITVFLIVATLVGTSPVAGQNVDISVGAPFPEMLLPSMEDGKPLSIADFRGEKVMLHVFASW